MGSLQGVYIVMATPFTQDESIDFDGVTKNLEHYIESGVDGVMVAGALGEYLTMTFAERKELVEHAAKVIDGRIPFMVGTIAHRTQDVIDLTNHAGE
ncbi:MAG: dihydrodipicolinate synthase family protein, partial [Desulfovibrionales bacterium]|nr:dihydrodipicolinate synthase family protein [Desulfovibrionales bacterium]